MDKSSMQIIVFFAMVVFVAVYVTITNNKRKQNAINALSSVRPLI